MSGVDSLSNYSGGKWIPSRSDRLCDVRNPATGAILSRVPFSTAEEVVETIEAASRAFAEWRRVPPTERIQYLFRLKNLLEENFDEIARLTTDECGKTLDEARGELRRGIENVEVAAGVPSLMMGVNLEDVAPGIDEMMIRQPVGVVAAITPFNFPAMIPLWFLPYAIACGNTFILKPSEQVPNTMSRVFELLDRLDLPPGVVNLVHGDKAAVDALLEHPAVRAVSFVGSTPVARYVYKTAAAHGKRAQCQGGAKNAVVVLPDADPETASRIIVDSAFGCAGQRCLATSLAVTVGEANDSFLEQLLDSARKRKVGYGADDDIEMGPVISAQSRDRILQVIDRGLGQGAELLVDGREARIPGYDNGHFLKPTIMKGIPVQGDLIRTEIFGPVLGVIETDDLDQAIRIINESSEYGNMACLFTSSGSAARKFRYEAQAGNIGINIGVAAPMAFFPFSGWRQSFFGDLHGQGADAIDFYTQKKVVVERWPREWSRKF